MTRRDIETAEQPWNREVEARIRLVLRGIYEDFGPWVSFAGGDLQVVWPRSVRSWTSRETKLHQNDRSALIFRGYIDQYLDGSLPRYRITVEGLIAIGAYPQELTGRTDGNEAEEDRGEKRKETKRKTGFVKAEDLYPSF